MRHAVRAAKVIGRVFRRRDAAGRAERAEEEHAGRAQEGLRQVLWLPDERLRLPAYGGRAGPGGIRRDCGHGAGRPRCPQYLQHPRKGRRQGLFGTRPRAEVRARNVRWMAAKTQIVVAGCVAQAEGAEILRRAKGVDLVVGPQSYHRLPEMLREARRRSRRRSIPTSLRRASSTPPSASRERTLARGVTGVRHRAGGLRQVLHVLRGPLHAGRRGVPARSRESSRKCGGWRMQACAR